MTVAAARRALTEEFRAAGLESPELDTRVLTAHALGLHHTALTLSDSRTLSDGEAASLNALAARRRAREPVARIVGSKEFWGLPLRITAATLVPRPETETVVEAALAAVDGGGTRDRPLRIADLGTGSGALLLALLSELPNAFGIGTDISEPALAATRENAAALGLLPRAGFVAGQFSAPLTSGFDLVVSNPPYIVSGDIAELAPEVQHDPRSALDGGADGLRCYRAIAADARRALAPTGLLVLELGLGQEGPVTTLLKASGLMPSPARADLAGIPRAMVARVATKTP
jgi:release factor glutamine methyltransferase